MADAIIPRTQKAELGHEMTSRPISKFTPHQITADPEYIRGMRVAARMFAGMDQIECELRSYGRYGAQDNAVRRTLDRVLMRGNENELEGFCASITGVLARAFEEMAPSAMAEILKNHSDRLQKVANRRLDRARLSAVQS
jgi:hypothetical protein